MKFKLRVYNITNTGRDIDPNIFFNELLKDRIIINCAHIKNMDGEYIDVDINEMHIEPTKTVRANYNA